MEGPGERLWVGEPDRLSLDDWWNPEEKLRLLCMGGGGVCLDSFFKMLRRRLREEPEGSAGGGTSNSPPILPQVPLYCYKRVLRSPIQSCASIHVPVLSLLLPTLLASPSHLGFAAHFPGGPNLDGGVLQRSGLQTHPVATLLKSAIR